jgi:hypothetical protein
MNKKIKIESFKDAVDEITELTNRVDLLEKFINMLVVKSKQTNKQSAISIHDMSGAMTNANRKISQLSKG